MGPCARAMAGGRAFECEAELASRASAVGHRSPLTSASAFGSAGQWSTRATSASDSAAASATHVARGEASRPVAPLHSSVLSQWQ